MADEEGLGWLMKKDSVTRKVDEELAWTLVSTGI
jgi:hypothetical protein